MLDRERVLESFRTALAECAAEIALRKVTLSLLASRACELYAMGLPSEIRPPSLWTFRAYLIGSRTDPEIVSLAESAGVPKASKLNRERLMESFRGAIENAARRNRKKLHPRTIAVSAHRLYCENLAKNERPPALVTFTQKTAGRTADAEIMEMIKECGIKNRVRVEIDRARMLASFRECLTQLSARIEKGLVRPIQVADFAHRLYLQSQLGGEPAPSRLTFRGFVYEKENHPELHEMLSRYFQT